jgi:tRNA dimethylallyltransferase
MGGYDLVVVTGPTASGKTAVAAELASRLEGEIISADSRQVYRGMNIGTGKDYDDYIVDGNQIPVHLIDIADPGHKYNVFEYQRDFLKVYSALISRGRFPVVCGGSGMYIDSIISGYKLIEVPPDHEFRKEMEKISLPDLVRKLSSLKSLHNRTDIDSKKRVIRALEIEHYYHKAGATFKEFPRVNALVTGISFDRESRRRRISERLRKRLHSGMIDEVKDLLEKGVDSGTLIYYGLEYRYITLFLKKEMSYEDMVRKLEIAIHQYAKRQMTWFRGMERRGIKIHWIDGHLSTSDQAGIIINFLSM